MKAYTRIPAIAQRLRQRRPHNEEFALAAARAAFGRHWCPPPMRDFQDVAPAKSQAARKAARFSDCDDDALADVFALACREMKAA